MEILIKLAVDNGYSSWLTVNLVMNMDVGLLGSG